MTRSQLDGGRFAKRRLRVELLEIELCGGNPDASINICTGQPFAFLARHNLSYPIITMLSVTSAPEKVAIYGANRDAWLNGSRPNSRVTRGHLGVESAVNEIVSKRMAKKQQMRWNRATVQPFLTVRTCVPQQDTGKRFPALASHLQIVTLRTPAISCGMTPRFFMLSKLLRSPGLLPL